MPRRDARRLPVSRAVRRTAHEIVRKTLREAIVSGAIAPGTRLVLSDVAKELNVSVTPVREAMRDLATDGLIQLDAYRGAIVRTISMTEAREVFELRALLEPEAARRAADNLTDAQFEELSAIQAEMDEVDDISRWVELNRRLHHMINAAAGSQLLAQTLERLEETATAYVALTMRAGSDDVARANVQHHDLIEALERRDGDWAADEIRRHLRHSLRLIEAAQATEMELRE
jgi:DNA-binding GntR family transcriptional regulator